MTNVGCFVEENDQLTKRERERGRKGGTSVTRFGAILPLWKKFKSFLEFFWMVYLVFGKPLYLLWYFDATG